MKLSKKDVVLYAAVMTLIINAINCVVMSLRFSSFSMKVLLPFPSVSGLGFVGVVDYCSTEVSL